MTTLRAEYRPSAGPGPTLDLLDCPTRFLFFTGKGGVGKTSLSAATALRLADSGKRVLLVSTDPASNLDEMLGVPLRHQPVQVPGAGGLWVLNIDPGGAADAYRERVLAQMDASATQEERGSVREQLSGSCTNEIAAFDEFASLLAGDMEAQDDGRPFDHVIFDTAPTGHTLRLLSLPKAWTGFLAGNDRGASCLGPHSGLKMQESRFQRALSALTDDRATTVVLVVRPDPCTLREAARTSRELAALGIRRQRLVVNGVFEPSVSGDLVADAVASLGREALGALPDELAGLPQDRVPLRAFDMVGLAAIRGLLGGGAPSPDPAAAERELKSLPAEPLSRLADDLASGGRGLIMVMGKGGVGKTMIASALAVGLIKRGHSVHLTTTDPAAHLAETLEGELPGLTVARIDPKAETQAYIEKALASRGRNLDEAEKALLLEDLQSPCTEEVAVFAAFSRVIHEAKHSFVVLDTAPTGHSLLLMDTAGSYHRQMMRQYRGTVGLKSMTTPLMRLRDPEYTKVLIVTLPEVIPVSQAAALQEDLRRAEIEPYAWVMNRSLAASGTRDPILLARMEGERKQADRIAGGLAKKTFVVPWLAYSPVGVPALESLTSTSG